MIIRPSQISDLATVEVLLRNASLPVSGVRENFRHYLVAEEDGSVVGSIGLEVYGETGLLRSAAVSPTLRGTGIGTRLYDHLIEKAKTLSVRRLLLLTETAEAFFAKKGFSVIDRNSVTGPVTLSTEFTVACPSSAICMELRLV